MNKAEIEKRIEEARVLIALYTPFWANLLAHLPMEYEEYEDALAATDGFTIYIDPDLSRYPNEIIAGVILHEVMHIAYKHFLRMEGRVQSLWNIATDIVINNAIERTTNFTLPKGALRDPKLHGYSAEEIYSMLIKGTKKSLAHGATDVYSNVASKENQKERKDWGVIEKAQRGKETFQPYVRLGPDRHIKSPHSLRRKREMEENIDNWLVESYNIWKTVNERRRGTIPGDILERIELLKSTTIPWRRILERYLNRIFVKDDYAPLPPSRRYLPYDLYFPSLKRETIEGEIVVAVDVSGSMSKKDIQNALSELVSLKFYTDRIYLIMHDTRVTVFKRPEELDFLKAGNEVKIKGRGGTDHRDVFNFIERMRLRPELFLGFTDGYSVFPKRLPHYPVIWITTKDYRKPPFGVCIEGNFKSARKVSKRI